MRIYSSHIPHSRVSSFWPFSPLQTVLPFLCMCLNLPQMSGCSTWLWHHPDPADFYTWPDSITPWQSRGNKYHLPWYSNLAESGTNKLMYFKFAFTFKRLTVYFYAWFYPMLFLRYRWSYVLSIFDFVGTLCWRQSNSCSVGGLINYPPFHAAKFISFQYPSHISIQFAARFMVSCLSMSDNGWLSIRQLSSLSVLEGYQ